eukprot:scaffold91417_cov54-Cyclotella_meneghiniana.AAC.1
MFFAITISRLHLNTCCPLLPTVSGARGGLFGAGGRFKGGTDPIMEKFNESIGFDKRQVVCLSPL